MPPADYTIDSLTPTIPAGHATTGIINIKINSALVGTTFKNYAIKLLITGGGGVQISNWNALTYNIQFTP